MEKGPAARRRPKAAGEAYFPYVEPAAEGANEADGPLSAACGVGEVGFGEALFPQQAGVAEAAGAPVGLGFVAGPGQCKVHSELDPASDSESR